MNRTVHEIEPEEVMAYLDGELEASRAGEVAAHVAGCSDCAKVADDLRGVEQKCAAWAIEPSAMAVEKLLKVEAGGPRVRAWRPSGIARLVRWLWGSPVPWRIAALGAGGLVCLFLLMETRSQFRRSGIEGFAGSTLSRRVASAQPAVRLGANGKLSVDDTTQLQQQREQAALSESLEQDQDSTLAVSPASVPRPAGPMIARTAEITLVVARLDDSRAALEKLMARHHGFASEMSLDRSNAASPSLSATLEVPAGELHAVLSELRGLGRVTTESQGGEDVSDQHVDLAARLHNARETEQRLLEILRTRTGKVGDVLAVEEQISQTRGQIEQMEAQLENLDKRVSYASVKLQMGEEYKAPAGAGNGVGLRLRNAIVGGYRGAVESLVGLAEFVLSAGPMILLWGALLFWPARAIWRRRGALRGMFGREVAN